MNKIYLLRAFIIPLVVLLGCFFMPWVSFSESSPIMRIFDKTTINIVIIVLNISCMVVYLLLTLLQATIKNKSSDILILLTPLFLVVAISTGCAYSWSFLYYQGSIYNYLVLYLTIFVSFLEISLISVQMIANIFDKRFMGMTEVGHVSKTPAKPAESLAFDDFDDAEMNNEGVNTEDAFALKNKVNKMQEGLKKTTIEMITEINETGEFAGVQLSDLQK